MLERPDLLVVRPQDGGQVARRVRQPVQLDFAAPQFPTEDAVLLCQLLRVDAWNESITTWRWFKTRPKRGKLHFRIEKKSDLCYVIYL